MGQSKPIALVVENDVTEREFASILLEECAHAGHPMRKR